MQYQLILFFVNISFLALVSFVFKLVAPKLKFLVFSTIYSYILAALLPFLLLWLSPQQTILFYVLAIGLVFVVILYRNKESEKTPTKAEERLFDQIKVLLPKVDQINQELLPETESAESNQISEIHIETTESETNLEEIIIEPDKPEEVKAEEIESSALIEIQEMNLDQPETIIKAEIPVEVRTTEATTSVESQDAEPIIIQDDNDLSGATDIQVDEILPDVEPAFIIEETADMAEIEEATQIIPLEDDQISIEPSLADEAKDLLIEIEVADNTEIEAPDQVDLTENDLVSDEPVQDISDKIELQSNLEIISIDDGDIGKTDHEPNNIEQLIIEAFDAKFNDDYSKALEMFEKILEQEPPEEIIHLILDDVEVLFAKLVS